MSGHSEDIKQNMKGVEKRIIILGGGISHRRNGNETDSTTEM
jgi:hypothetical protein